MTFVQPCQGVFTILKHTPLPIVLSERRSSHKRYVVKPTIPFGRGPWWAARGHVNTLRPYFARTLGSALRPPTEPFVTQLSDPIAGEVDVTGVYLRGDPSRVVIFIHGLGGNTDSGYMTQALAAVHQLGVSALLLNCRGADRRGADFYHSGLTADLSAAISSEALSGAREIDLVGYSIGGHIALCYACAQPDPRVRRIAAICSPLDLAVAADDFDRQYLNVYRSHVMDGLKEIYTCAYQRRPVGLVPIEARKIRKIRTWDQMIIAPRFGFLSADHYYESESVGPRLSQLKREAIYIGAVADPMVRARGVEPYLDAARLTVVWDERAGHLGFEPNFDLGRPGPLGLESQVLSWLAR